jgi:hypothetical protein
MQVVKFSLELMTAKYHSAAAVKSKIAAKLSDVYCPFWVN